MTKSTARLFFSLILILSLPNLISAQDPGGPSAGAVELYAKGKIKGTIVDAATQQPLEFATVSILAPADSSIVTGGISDLKGYFEIESEFGTYLIKIEFIAYQALYLEDIELSKKMPVVNLGIVELSSDAQVLEEIEVRAEKSQLQMAFDKKVFNVGKDLSTTSGNAAQVLDNIPSVTVDVEGNVSLRGNDGVRILVNGKPSGLVGVRGAGGLQSLPANLIEKVEIITNPSARYEAEGMTGIINIVLKKDRRTGLNGAFDISGGVPGSFGAGVNLNYRRKKFNLFANYGLRYRQGPGRSTRFQEFYRGDTTLFVDQVGDRQRGGLSNSVRIGTDYLFDKYNTLTGSFQYRMSNDDNTSKITYRNYINDFPGNLTEVRIRSQEEDEREPNLEYDLNYRRTYDRKGQELNASIQYRESSEDAFSAFEESVLNSELIPTRDDLLQRASNDETEKSFLMQADYIYPLSKDGKVEVGYRGSLRRIDNDYLVEDFGDDRWIRDDSLSNDFNYDENIHAAYVSISNKISKFSYQVGLRAEHSEVLTELLETGEKNDRNYTNLFPSIFLGYELADENSFQLSYSRRIRRPRFWDLNPFFTFSDSRNIFRGNPNLDPEFTHSFELSYIKYWQKVSITSSVYYRHTDGVIDRIQSLTEQDGELITIRQPENLATENAYGLEFIVSADPFKWWRINADVNLYRAITDGTNLGQSFEADTYTMSGRINSRTTLWKSLDLQLSTSYRAPRETTQGKTKAYYMVDLGASHDILQGKGTLTLSVRDLLNSRRYRTVAFGDDFYSSGSFQWRARSATLTFNYRLNQQKRRGGRGGGGDYDGGDMEF